MFTRTHVFPNLFPLGYLLQFFFSTGKLTPDNPSPPFPPNWVFNRFLPFFWMGVFSYCISHSGMDSVEASLSKKPVLYVLSDFTLHLPKTQWSLLTRGAEVYPYFLARVKGFPPVRNSILASEWSIQYQASTSFPSLQKDPSPLSKVGCVGRVV